MDLLVLDVRHDRLALLEPSFARVQFVLFRKTAFHGNAFLTQFRVVENWRFFSKVLTINWKQQTHVRHFNGEFGHETPVRVRVAAALEHLVPFADLHVFHAIIFLAPERIRL